eukprot:IDg41t1
MGNMLRGTQNTIPSPLRRMPTKSCADTGSPHIKTHVKRQKTHFKIYFLYQRPSLCACALRYTSSCYRHGCLLCSAHVAQKRESERRSNAMRATTAAHSALFANAHRHRPRLANANKEQRHCASRYNTRPFARHLHVTICTSPSARQYTHGSRLRIGAAAHRLSCYACAPYRISTRLSRPNDFNLPLSHALRIPHAPACARQRTETRPCAA